MIKNIYRRNKVRVQLGLILTLTILSLSWIELAIVGFDGLSDDGFEIFNDYDAQIKTSLITNRYSTAAIEYLIEYSDGNEVFHWGWITMDSQGIGYTFQFLRDIDNDNDYDYNFDQQLRITQISVINSTDQWDASIGDAQYYIGKKPENFLSQHDIIPGTRYSNPDRIVHEIWMKAIEMPLHQHFDASAIEGTIDVWLNCTLTTYQDRSELKVGVTINLEGSGLPMNYDTPYTLRMVFTNSLGQREYVGATNGFGLEADEVSNYTATYHLPTNETISSYRLDRNYTETREGIEYQKQANPYLDGPQGSGKHYGGNYDFTDLIWGRTTQVSLDPTMINYGSYGAGTSAIDGFQVIPLIILSFLGVAILMLNVRRKIR